MALRAEAPQGWNEFVMAMRENAATSTTDVLRVTPDLLLKAQGMAIMAHELATVLNDAPKLYDKMMEKKHGQTAGQNSRPPGSIYPQTA